MATFKQVPTIEPCHRSLIYKTVGKFSQQINDFYKITYKNINMMHTSFSIYLDWHFELDKASYVCDAKP